MRKAPRFPTSLLEFETVFPDEDACIAYLRSVRWPDGFRCPKCGDAGWGLKGRPLFECRQGHQTSLTAGTVFHGTRKPLRLWFRAMFLMTAQKQGLSAKNLMRLLGFRSYQTAWHWLHKLRRAMVRTGRSKLVGRVEEDESWMYGAAEGTGKGCGLPLVAGAVEATENGIGRVRLAFIPDQGGETLSAFTHDNVLPGTTVATDGWQAYMRLADEGYRHVRMIRRPKQLAAIHRVFGLLKRWLLGTHQGAVAPKHLQAYLDEFTFRFNRRRSATPGKLFVRLAEGAVQTPALTYESLVAA